MRRPVILVTGASGEIGHSLVSRLAADGRAIVTLDVNQLDRTHAALVKRRVHRIGHRQGDLLDRLLAEFEVDRVFHLAALLSTRAEFTPTDGASRQRRGTLNLLEFASARANRTDVLSSSSTLRRSPTYGLPTSSRQKTRRSRARGRTSFTRRRCTVATSCIARSSDAITRGTTSSSQSDVTPHVDFRAVRFPGLISATTLAGGRHVGLRVGDDSRGGERQPYACFVRPDTDDSVHGDA